MTRGYSLKKDFRLLINNPKYSDIEILCEDEIKLHGCRAVLAARFEVFDSLLYNGMKESYEKKISLPNINSSDMKVVLEYVYTGVIKEKSLTKDNIVEVFSAADYFQLPGLIDFIMKTVKNTLEKNCNDNYSPELLSKFVDKNPISEDNILFNLLIEAVSAIPLNNIEFGRLSTIALQILLSCTYEKKMYFATLEYEVFRYCTISVANQISYDATKTLLKRLPTLENIDYTNQIDNEPIPDHQKIIEDLEPLVKFIDFRRIKVQMSDKIIEPLKIIPDETILNVYRNKIILNNADFNEYRGVLQKINESNCVWDESECGTGLIIENNGKVVRTQSGYSRQNVRAKFAIENKEILNHESFAGYQHAGWVLGSSGTTVHSNNSVKYCPAFNQDNSKVTVHLDMYKRTCAFTVNGTKYPPVAEWNDLPSKLYPVVSLKYPGQFRIQSHQKI
ncbi:8940_t:CDS:2 [Funneliformis geosporum]|nr:8940_t:CDS:2 [Funneliformis geosporum]